MHRLYESVGELEKEIRFDYSMEPGLRDAIKHGMQHAREKGAYAYEGCEQAVLNVINGVRLLSLERFFEDTADVPADRMRECAKLFLKAYTQFGYNVSDYFILRYSEALGTGLNPQDYFDFVATAVSEGGRRFGAWYAYALPHAYGAGADPIDFMENASRVCAYGIAVLRPFVLGAPGLLKRGFTSEALADLAEAAVAGTDEKTASWILRNMGSLAGLGYNPEDFLADTIRLAKERGEKAALWYAYGFSGMVRLAEHFDREARPLKWNGNDPKLRQELERTNKKRMSRAMKKRGALKPERFKDGYMDLLGSGQSAATFYSLSVRIQEDTHIPSISPVSGEYTYFSDIPEATKRLKSRANRKVFSSAMWFVPKIVSSPVYAAPMLDAIASEFSQYGEADTLAAIYYTHGMRRHGGYPDTLMLLHEENIGETTDASEPPDDAEWDGLRDYIDRVTNELKNVPDFMDEPE